MTSASNRLFLVSTTYSECEIKDVAPQLPEKPTILHTDPSSVRFTCPTMRIVDEYEPGRSIGLAFFPTAFPESVRAGSARTLVYPQPSVQRPAECPRSSRSFFVHKKELARPVMLTTPLFNRRLGRTH